jgi:hypothetical protein
MKNLLVTLALVAATGGTIARSENECNVANNTPSGCEFPAKYFCEYLGVTKDSSVEVISDKKVYLKKGEWVSMNACDCRMAPCGRVRECMTAKKGKSESFEVCLSVGGELTVEAKSSMLLKLLGELGVSVSVSAELQGCYTYSESIEFDVPGEQCFERHGRACVWKHEGTITRTEAKYIFHWRVWDFAKGKVWNVALPCDVTRHGSLSAQVDGGVEIHDAPILEDCGSIVNEDIYDGMRANPCCRPMPECDPGVPPEQWCCGCKGNH